MTALTLGAGAAPQAGPAPPLPRFEVVSIRPVGPADMGNGTRHGGGVIDPSHWREQAVGALWLTNIAYDFRLNDSERVIGLPSWTDKELYTIEAVIPPHTVQSQIALMVRAMLADRFQMKVQMETRLMLAVSMGVAPGGAKLSLDSACNRPDLPLQAVPGLAAMLSKTPTTPAPGTTALACGDFKSSIHDGTVTYQARGVTMATLANALFTTVHGLPVVDQTGLKGSYDFAVSFPTMSGSQARTLTRDQLDAIEEDYLRRREQAFLNQLGLKLTLSRPTKLPVPVVVVDHIERPTPN